MTELQRPISDRVRLIRWRMSNERSSFLQELRLIPRWLVSLVITLFVIAEAVAQIVYTFIEHPEPPRIVLAAAVAGVSAFIAAILFLIAYVNRDAERRGMNSTLWTLLVIILLPAWLATGFVIYFLVREPLPFNCPQCGATVMARFNYCPSCKFNLHPTCPECKREVRTEDKYCPFCAYDLKDRPVAAAELRQGEVAAPNTPA